MTVSAVGTDGSTTNPGGGRSLVNADGALYEAVFRLCTPAPPFAEPWQSIAPPVDARGPILDPAHALRTLRQKFGDSRLRVAGVLRSAPDGSDHLAPGLVQPTGAVLALRAAPGSRPFTLLTAQGSLICGEHPLEYDLHDHWLRARIAEHGILYLAMHMEDALLLRALDLPVAFTPSLATARPDELQRMAYALLRVEIPRIGPSAGQLRTLLIGWSVMRMDAQPPAILADVVARLVDGGNDMDFMILSLAMRGWKMDDRRLADLRRALGASNPAAAGGLLTRDLMMVPYIEVDIPTNAPAGSYVEVRAEFRATQAAGGDGSHVRRRAALAKAEFLRAVDTKLIAPLRAAALAARTPVARDALLQFAAASEILHLLTPTICELLCHGNTDSRPARRKHAQYLKFLRTYGRLLPAVLKARAGVR